MLGSIMHFEKFLLEIFGPSTLDIFCVNTMSFIFNIFLDFSNLVLYLI
jgi:hypothetical protein